MFYQIYRFILTFITLGWGGEDDDFRTNRIFNSTVVRFDPHISRYTMLEHDKALPNPNRFAQLNSYKKILLDTDYTEKNNKSLAGHVTSTFDGLSDIQYNIISISKKPLFTHIIVDF